MTAGVAIQRVPSRLTAPWEEGNARGIDGDRDNNASQLSGAVYLY
jgi:hypothetical protein